MAYCYRYKLMIKPAQVLALTKSWPSVMLQRPCWPCLASTNPLPSPPNLPSSRPAIRRSVQTSLYLGSYSFHWFSLSLSLSIEITVESLNFMMAQILCIFFCPKFPSLKNLHSQWFMKHGVSWLITVVQNYVSMNLRKNLQCYPRKLAFLIFNKIHCIQTLWHILSTVLFVSLLIRSMFLGFVLYHFLNSLVLRCFF